MGKKERRGDHLPWWKFPNRERRALLWLLPVLAVVSWLVWEAARPRFDDALPEYADLVNSADKPAADTPGTTADSLFAFDPNTIEYHDLCRLGFSRNEALGIVKYRERGKVFEIPEDFASCYQISEDMYRRLRPYINIGEGYRLKSYGRGGDKEKPANRGEGKRQSELRPFSLDTITAAGLRELGFSVRQAEVIVNYRDMRGGLRSAEEFAECYVVSDEMFARLEPYLVFPEQAVKSSAAREPVDLNRADSASLRSVAGIGEKTVVSIMEYRERLGGFVRAEQLAEVRGMTEQNYERICRQIFVDSCVIQKIDINFASAKDLGRHPYIQDKQLRRLLKLRQLKGGWNNTGELVEDKIFTPEEAEKVAPYLLFGPIPQ